MRRILAFTTVLLLAATTAHAQGRQLRVLVLHDMEGLAGQDDWRQFSFGYPEQYAKGRQLLVDDVNATIEGLFAGGATKVDVVDGHGSGNQEPDIPLDKLDQRAQMVYKNRPFDPYIDMQDAGVYDAVALVGMHAKPGSGGFAAHTYTGGMEFWMNGRSLSEPEIIGYSWGRVNVPVIYVAGDEVLGKKDLATTMPWIEFVATKGGTSASTAELFPLDSVRANMRAAAKRALENLSKMKTMTLQTPITAALHARPPASLRVLDSVPGINYKDETVSFSAADYEQAYRGIVALVSVASLGGAQATMGEALRQQPNWAQMQRGISEFRVGRWLDYESGRWKPAEPVPFEVRIAGKKFFGDR
ncbi:MAG: M55 family metallopeptidase [Gemmatimonadetes bacterium]|nr:M55 family metallopeptidase [Gemmatimonadota bacterium]